MQKLMDDVTAFHRATDTPVVETPHILTLERDKLRRSLITEEMAELFSAMDDGDLPQVADAIADSIYVLVGTALEFGIPLAEIWSAVQQANMAKIDPITGKVLRRADGKILKPEGWQAPDIAAIIARAQQPLWK